jgi:hypothetical protein
MNSEPRGPSSPVDAVVMRAIEIVNAVEWSGDMRVNMTCVVGAGRVLAKRVNELQSFIEEVPCECHDEYGKPLGVACGRYRALGRDGRSA